MCTFDTTINISDSEGSHFSLVFTHLLCTSCKFHLHILDEEASLPFSNSVPLRLSITWGTFGNGGKSKSSSDDISPDMKSSSFTLLRFLEPTTI